MSKKILLISAAAVIGAGALVGGGAGITYQVKWTQFKKDFDSNVKKISLGVNSDSTVKLTSTSDHTVVYTFSQYGKPILISSEHYSAFSKFNINSVTTKLSL